MKNLYSTLFILFIGLAAFGQNAEIKKADKLFAQRAYIDAAEAYEKVVDKNQEVLQNLGDAYFYTNQMESAAEVYRTLFLRHEDITEPEYKFRFAHSLRAIGEQEEADKNMSDYTGEDISYEEFSRELDTIAPHVYTTNQIMNNSASADFGIAFYGDRITFASTRNQERPVYPWNKKPTLDLYSAEMSEDGELSDIVLFSDEINTDEHESSATFSEDGQVMYFDRNSEKRVKNEEGIRVGHIKIFRAEMVDGKWDNIEALPFTSDEYSTEHPSLSADGSKLYFASDMPGTEGSFDIYVVDVNEDGTYGEPENLGTGVNTPHREQFPYISEEGVLYFASDGHQGFGNLDVFRAEGDFAEVQNLGNTVNSGHDDFAFIINEENQKGYLASNRRGSDNLYVFTRENYVPPVVDYDDRETNLETGRQQLRDVGNIYFDFDKATIKAESKPTLDKVVNIMNKYPELKIEIGSHADARGSDKYNMGLSERRAASTLEYLVENGIDRSRLTSKGYGESMPLNDCTEPTGCTNEQYAKNRRSEFTIMN
ncbi:peptidoglycan-associated lipoprotein [Salegentibacter agarivorans]|uniref:Peptidoglycan-associated lipoprotein n=1 Tax=Salegentibacter agarivorans TaxID=345907 RepID=A0A1I2P5P7_9FLAO|nr:OmpA family protein [Salegentibacter agarivorans]SFG10409.1 peptidoglycan-associated lipoprotein [Salegentibacter agarivorans]